MAAATTRRPSFIDICSSTPVDPTLSPKTPISISKPRRLSLPPITIDSQLQQQQQYSDRVPWTPTMLSDSTSSNYFHDDLSNSVMLTKNQSTVDHERHFSKVSDAVSLTAVAMQQQLPPGFEGHMSYKIKAAKSLRKLDCFFGEHAPHDTCIKEIRKEGLKAMLQSKTPLCYFLYHLLKEYCSENLFFFIEIEQYEAFEYSSTVQQFATAQHIHSTYLTRSSQFEVNLDDKVRRTVTDALRDKQMQGCFAMAKHAVYNLLESSYMRFLQTDVFELMVHNCGELTTHYNEAARHAAPRLLLEYIDQQHAMIYTNPHTDQTVLLSTSNQSSRRRHELIRSMIQEFCRTILDLHVECSSSLKSSTTQGHSSITKPFDFLFPRRKH